MPTHFLPDEEGNTQRPELINVLGVLSFINTGLFLLFYALGALGMLALGQLPLEEFMMQVRDSAKWLNEEQFTQMEQLMRILHGHGAGLMGLLWLRTLLRLLGTIGIWRGYRSGFHLYAAAQLGGIFLPHLILPLAYLGVGGPLMAVAVTALFGTQYKRLG
ncbi:MAG: hypothetical protein R2817_07905 [Flavobacteriales bacterium]